MPSERLRVIGNSELLLCSGGADIPIVRAPSVAPSFCSFSMEKERFELKSAYHGREKLFRHTFYSDGLKAAELFDSFDGDSAVFVRRCICYEELEFSFAFEKQITVFFDSALKTSRAGYPALCLCLPARSAVPGFTPSAEDRFLMIAFCGSVDFDSESASGRFLIGESSMIICADTDPNRLYSRAVAALGHYSQLAGILPKLTTPEDNDPEEYINALISMTNERGFVLCDPTRLSIDPMTQYFAVRAFLHAGKIKRARTIIDSYCRIFSEKGSILWCEEGGRRTLRSAFDASVTYALIILAALSFPTGALTERQISVLCDMMKAQKLLLANNMMPFNGNEGEPEAMFLPYQGSALATLLFIQSGRELSGFLKNSGSSRLEDIERSVDTAAACFHENFIKDGIPFLNCPTRDVLKAQPRFKFGYCEYCSPRTADPQPRWVCKNHGGMYLCPDCVKKVPGAAHRPHLDRNARRISYNTVLLAALLGSDVYPRGLVRQIASSLISYPSGITSCFEAATLCYVARRYELDKKYVDMADSILFTKEKQADVFELRKDTESRLFSVFDSKSYAVMYTTFEYHALPKRKTKKRPEGAMFTQMKDVE